MILQAVYLTASGFHVTGISALVRACSGFAVGIVLSLIIMHVTRHGLMANIAAVALIALVAVGLPGIAVIPAAVLILALSKPDTGFCHRVVSSRISVWLGRVSYSIYLLHAPLLIVFLIGLKHFHQLQTNFGVLVFSITYVCIVLIASTCTYYLIENPSRYVVQNMWRRQHMQLKTLA